MRSIRSRMIPLLLIVTLPALSALAQEAAAPPEMTPEQQAEMETYMKAGTPGPQHARLAEAAGTYDIAMKSWTDPSMPPMEMTGTATRSMTLDGRVLVEELSSSMMGMPFEGRGMTGYDNVSGTYWSIWTDNMSTGVMLAEGTCNDEGACTLTGKWNDAVKKGPVVMRMVSRWKDASTEVFEMYGPGRDGKEMKMMEMTYTKR